MAPDERWVGVDDVAAHLGVGKDSIYRWVENRGLPARKVGRLLRFRLSEVDAWVEAGEGERPAEPPPPAPAPRRGRRSKKKDGGR
ncbi:MAG: helix-turn-helix domain-containing protein [Deltaproteobacteria bacterium]|nr:helix-turn-helix domain-containing protein [Deltaproteobacteria bacterium]